jgi:2-polyprenyl-3-methyl-5-hydroxy-6-metoxy-1,4-benzoquinol methylase
MMYDAVAGTASANMPTIAMRWDSTTDDWEKLGQLDPYWAVIGDESYHRGNMSDAQLARFLESGEAYVEHLWRRCREAFGTSFAPVRALDFGCGVGRVALPMAKRTESVVAVDVADSMLSQAGVLLARQGVTNVELVKGDDTLSRVTGTFDFVHSLIVFQHIPVSRGLGLVKRLVALAGDRGVVVLHVLYENPFQRTWPIRIASRALRPLRRLRGRPPEIQMNPYPLNAVFGLIHEAGVQAFRVELTDHAGHLGATFVFRKDRSS